MYFQDVETGLALWQVQHHLAVEAAGPGQCGIENIRAVGGGDHHHGLAGTEAIHLGENLVEGLFALIVADADIAARATDRIDLVDEDQCRRDLARFLEHIAHPRGADADEHLHELGTGDAEERYPRLSRRGLGEQGLARTRWPDHQDALGNMGTDGAVLLRLLEKIDDLGEILLGVGQTGDVVVADLDVFLLAQLGPGLGHAEQPATGHAATHLAAHGPRGHHEDTDQQGPGQQGY